MHYSDASYRRRMAIENELLNLMQEIPFEQITVLDIAQRQNIARKTFYRYFPNKQACLEGLIDRAIYECSISLLHENSLRSHFEGWLLFWQDHRDLLNAIIQNRLDHLLVERLAAYAQKEEPTLLTQMSTDQMESDTDILHFYLSGHVAMLIRWGAAGFPLPLEKMVEKLYRLTHEPLIRE